MKTGELGKVFRNGEVIVRQREVGNCMYVIQEGTVEVVEETGNKPLRLAILKEGDFFGEMSVFEREVRSATVRALGEVRVITVDKRTILRRVTEDPSLAFRLVEKMSNRLRLLNRELVRSKSDDDSTRRME